MSDRYYSFWIVTYHTDLSIIQNFCNYTFKYAYILHDKDKDKSPHYHIICSFKQNKSFASVRALFPDGQNTIVKSLTDRYGAFTYLTHENEPDKFHYSSDSRVCNDLSYFSKLNTSAPDNEEFLNDLSPYSMLSMRDLAIKYGRDLIKNYKIYKDFASSAYSQQCDIERGHSSYIDCIPYENFVSEVRFIALNHLDLNMYAPNTDIDKQFWLGLLYY